MNKVEVSKRNLLPLSFAIKCRNNSHPQWQLYMDFINETSGTTWNGDSESSYYGIRSRVDEFGIYTNESFCNDSIEVQKIFTMSEFLSIVGIEEIQIEMVTTYNDEEHPLDKCVELNEYSEFSGQYALLSDCEEDHYNNGYALSTEMIHVHDNGYTTRENMDDHDIVYSEVDDEYLDTDDSDVRHGYYYYNGRVCEGCFLETRDTVCLDDEWYRNNRTIELAGYIWSSRCDEWIHQDNWDDYQHGDYYDDDEEANNASYHDLTRQTRFDSSAKFTIGFEIEKEDSDMACLDYDRLYSNTGWIKEKDGSLDDATGYELVSPAFDLFDDKLDNEILDSHDITNLINASYSSSCGGHINLGSTMYTPEQLFEGISGFFPLFYAMYENRLTQSYSKAKKKHEYYSRDKYSSILIKPNVVEIRIPSAVINVKNLIWRRDLMRIIVDNFNKSELQVLRMLANTKSKLHIHLRRVYSLDKVVDKIEKFIKYSEQFNNKKLPNVNTARLVEKDSLGA